MHSAPDPVRCEYTTAAADYDRRWARYVERSSQETLAHLALARTDRVLDVGCGTGVLLARLAERIPANRLAGVDLTPAMLALAGERLPTGVSLGTARAEALPFDDGAFDAAISCNVLHFVGEPASALREMHRVLGPGGRVAITDWCHDNLTCRMLGWWLRLTGRPCPRIHGAAELARMLQAAGFASISTSRYRIGWWWGMMTLTARKPE